MDDGQVIRTESWRRGVIAWTVSVLFYGFHIVMIVINLLAFVFALEIVSIIEAQTELLGAIPVLAELGEQISTLIEVILFLIPLIAVLVPLSVWALGAVPLGILMYFTHGRRVIRSLKPRHATPKEEKVDTQ